MLQEIRERAQGWVAWAIVILITIPFAFWGIDSYFGGGAERVVASVNGIEITERAFNQNVNRTRIQLRDQLGEAYDPALFGDQRLRQEVLDRMVRETLLLEDSRAMGLRASDDAVRAAILSEPAFQQDGVYSKEQYERVLQLQGLTPAAYEESVRQQLLLTQLPRAIRETVLITDGLARQSASLLRQERALAYAEVPSSAFLDAAETPDAAAIQAYYDEHAADAFAVPAQVQLSYLLLDAEDLEAPEDQVDEATLREQYELRLDRFTEPEQRKVRHILVTLPADADSAQAETARERVQAIRQRITAGEPFGAVAAEASQDPASAERGGELGWVGRGALDPAFEQAVFDLEPEVLSEVVRSRFGYHLVEVLEVRGGTPQPFEDVADELRAELSSGSSEAAFFEQAEQLATLTYESPDSLIPAAEALGLEVQTTDWLDESGGEGLFAMPRVMQAAFSEEVLELGHNSELLEPDPDRLQALVLRVAEYQKASVQPLEAVRDEIIATLQAEQATAAAMAEAKAIAERVESGAALEAAAEGLEVVAAGQVDRTATEVPADVLDLAFSLPRPAAGGPAQVSTTETEDGDAIVVVVSRVVDGAPDALDDAELATEARVLGRISASADVEQVLASMMARAKIEREPIGAEDEAL